MGMAMGQDCELLTEVCGWIHKAAKKPVWAKMTPNITDITQPARWCGEVGGKGGRLALRACREEESRGSAAAARGAARLC